MRYAIDYMLLELDTESVFKKKIGNLELDLLNPYSKTLDDYLPKDEYIINRGKVLGVPAKLPFRSKLFGIDLEVEVGDEVYVHHFALDTERHYLEGDRSHYFFEYILDFGTRMSSNVYCVVRDGSIKMVADHVLVKACDEVTKFGDYVKNKPSDVYVDVIEVNKLSTFKRGDRVLVNPSSGCDIIIEGEEYRIYPNEDIWAVLPEGATISNCVLS